MVWDKIKSFPLKFEAVMLAGVLAFSYGVFCFRTGETNPIKQAKYPIAWHQIYGKNGHADTNKDGKISTGEKIASYEIMGIENKIEFETFDIKDNEGWVKYEIKGESTVFYNPTLKELEKGLEFYLGGKE